MVASGRAQHYQWWGLSLLALLLAGCGSVPQSAPEQRSVPANASRPAVPATPSTPARSELPVLPPAGSGRGGYYQDDGPGDAPPAGLMQVPDAVPRVEPYSTRGNRPYVVFGRRYVPILDDRPYKERGRGSWYGKKFQGQRTSSGEPYDMYKMTAAHPTLPIPSYARVTNLANGKQVIVRINDRGPFHPGRIIDLSYTAALKLGYLASGSAELEVERLLPADIERMAAARNAAPEAEAQSAAQDAPMSDGESESRPLADMRLPRPIPSRPQAPAATPASLIVSSSPTAAAPATPAAPAADVKPAPSTTPAAGIYLQFGTYSQAANAEAVQLRLQQKTVGDMPPVEVAGYGSLYRVFSGPFASRDEALGVARRLQADGAPKPMVVQR